MTGRWVIVDELQRRVKEIHGGVVTVVADTYVNMGTKAQFVDIDYGSWWTKPGNVVHRKSGHPCRAEFKRARVCRANSIALANRPIEVRRRVDLSGVKQRLYELHGDIMIIDDETYVNMVTKAMFIDVEFGECWLDPHSVLTKNKVHPVEQDA